MNDRHGGLPGLAAVVPTVLLAVVTVVAIGSGDRGSDPRVVAPAPSGYDYAEPGATVPLGTGEVEAFSQDGSAVVVSDMDDRHAERRCEGFPEPVLIRVARAGGDRQVLLDSGGAALRGAVFEGPEAKVALVETCEEFLGRISVGTMAASGTIDGAAEVPSGEVGGTAHVVDWEPSGDHLFLNRLGESSTDWAAVRLDLTDGHVSEVFPYRDRDPGPFGQRPDGRYVVADPNADQVRIQRLGAEPEGEAPGDAFTIAPDGRRVAVLGPALTILTTEGTERLVTTGDGERIILARWSPTGDALAYVTERTDPATKESTNTVFVLPLDGKPVRLTSEAGHYGGLSFSGQGDVLAYHRVRYDPDHEAQAFTVRFPAR